MAWWRSSIAHWRRCWGDSVVNNQSSDTVTSMLYFLRIEKFPKILHSLRHLNWCMGGLLEGPCTFFVTCGPRILMSMKWSLAISLQYIETCHCQQTCFDDHDCRWRIILQTDASDVGLGATLLQDRDGQIFPVAYASRKLLGRERRYSVMDRECLEIVLGIQKFGMVNRSLSKLIIVRCSSWVLQNLRVPVLCNGFTEL